jgi:Transmembrane domain of unknown function (DUF3566)
VGVEHHVEPPSGLPERAAAAATDEVTVASSPADDAGEKQSPNGAHDLNGAGGETQQVPAADSGSPAPDSSTSGSSTPNGSQESADADPISYSQDASPGDVQPGTYDYRQDTVYTADYPAAENGYNDGVSQSGYSSGVSPPAGGESTVPPYPAELPAQEPATGTKTALAAAAARALPKPRPTTQPTQARRANLVIARLEPWSVMKFSFLMSLVAWVVLFVAVALLYYALSGLGVFAAVERTLQSVTSSQQSAGVSLTNWLSASRVLGYTMLIGAVDIILITALSTIGAVIYNLVTHLGGGIEVTLRETD